MRDKKENPKNKTLDKISFNLERETREKNRELKFGGYMGFKPLNQERNIEKKTWDIEWENSRVISTRVDMENLCIIKVERENLYKFAG